MFLPMTVNLPCVVEMERGSGAQPVPWDSLGSPGHGGSGFAWKSRAPGVDFIGGLETQSQNLPRFCPWARLGFLKIILFPFRFLWDPHIFRNQILPGLLAVGQCDKGPLEVWMLPSVLCAS